MSPPKGYKFSAETRERMRAGQLRRFEDPAARAQASAAHMGVKHSAAARAKIRAAKLGSKANAETRAKLRSSHLGQFVSPETRAKLSVLRKGNENARNAPVKGECVYCFGPATTHDHVIPRGRPGWDDPDNIVEACLPCNLWKGDRTPEEWFDGAPIGRWRGAGG